MRRLTKKEYVLAGIFAFIAAYPLATADEGAFGLNILPPIGSLVSVDRGDVNRDDRNTYLRERAQVMRVCTNRLQNDPETVCPDMNDPTAVRVFLRGLPTVHKAATGSIADTLTILDLTETQRGLMRRLIRVRTCPDTLDDILPGFLELCESVLEDSTDDRTAPTDNWASPRSLFPLIDRSLNEIIKTKSTGLPR